MPNNWISHINIGGVQKDIRDNTIQVTDIPTASDDNLGRVVQYMGVTNGSYTHNYFYECVRNGFTYSWTPTSVQAGGGGGHTIEDSEGTELTQRDTLQFGEGFVAEDDDTNEKTVISPDIMQSGDMSDVITPLPSVGNKLPVLFDESGAERQVGWYKYANGTKKPVYEKCLTGSVVLQPTWISMNINDDIEVVQIIGIARATDGGVLPITYANTGNYTLSVVANNSAHKGQFAFFGSTNYATNHTYYIRFLYTKTTDIAE